MKIILIIFTFINFFSTNYYAQNINYQYDNLNRLTNIDYDNGTIISYTYDDVGNRIGLIIQGSGLPPNAPSNVNIVTNNSNVIISWDEVTGVSSYKIYASDNPEGPFVDISGAGTFGTATRIATVTKLSSQRKQNTKTKNKVCDDNRNQQTWTSGISGIGKKFYYVTASTEERNNIPTLIKKKSFNNLKKK